MGQLILLLAFMVGLVAGPFVVARLFPGRSSVDGNAVTGESGVSSVFWGTSLGLTIGYIVLSVLIIVDPIGGSLSVRLQIAGVLFAVLGLVLAPMILCGFHRWRWNAEGVEFIGVLRRRSLLWNDISSVRRFRRTGWTLQTTTGSKLHFADGYVPGLPFIIAALSTNRSDLTAQIEAATNAERP